jgi:ribosomal protein S18 acetylase RimI-like enzyme
VFRPGEGEAVEGWQLREATEADAGTLAALVREAFEDYRGRLDPPSGAHAETPQAVRERLCSARAVLALAGEVAAGCVFYEKQEGRVYLSRLAVRPACRGRGLGRALIEYVEGRARALGLPRVRLGVRLALTQQRAYYERLGYGPVETGAHAGYAEPTYLLMEKPLS